MQGRKSGGRWKRIVLWSAVGLVVALLAVAGGFYLWLRAQVSEANERVPEEVIAVLAEEPSSTITSVPAEYQPDSPDAMNILVLGSDRRADEDERGRSDTIILLRVDPDNDYLGILSLPRDLRVDVPGYGKQKINAAYSFGGPALSIRTIEQVTGIDVDHYVEVDFQAFEAMTDSLGGVYVEVDRRYYNADPTWELINLEPGYQRLDGADALDFCRFRHDLNMDFGRMERQQRFLSALRQQAMGWDLPLELPGLISALFSNIATDLGTNDLIKLAWWVIRLDGSHMRQQTIVGDTKTIAGASYVLLDEEALARAVGDFFTPAATAVATTTTSESEDATATTAIAVGRELEDLEIDVLNANGRDGEAAAAAEWLRDMGATVLAVGNADEKAVQSSVEYPSGLKEEAEQVASVVGAFEVTRDRSLERITVVLGDDFTLPPAFALPLRPENVPGYGAWRTIAQTVPFAVQAPAYLPRGYGYVDRRPTDGGTYDIDGGAGGKPAFVMLYRLFQDGEATDQYMSITQTSWTDAPAASEGTQAVHDGTMYVVVGTKDKVERVWWKSDGVLCWVSNTLSHLLSEQEMLAVARSMVPMPPE